MEDLIVSVSSPPDIDIDIFTYWIEGRPSEEAGVYKIESLRKLNQTIGLEFPKINNDYYPNLPNQLDFIKYEVDDQYCLFTLLEHYLSIPQLLKIQTVCSISIDLQNVLIDKYWSLDDLFIREILNRKLINKNRKDIEEISEITGLNIRRITRQYDNLKKMFSLFEENSIHHHHNYDNLYSFISKTYLLNHHLSKKYTCILFLLYHKFTLTSKRRIQKLPCENLERCGALILTFLCMDHTTFFQGLASYDPPSDASWFENLQNGWNYVWKVFPAVSSYELDKQLLNNLRDFRAIMSGETLDVSCTLVRNRLTPPILRKLEGSSAQTSPSHGKLRNVIKSLLQLAANLSQSREFRDLFEDIITKIAEPLEESGLNVAEINTFLCACAYMEITEGGSRAMSLLKAPSEGTSTRSSLEHGTSISSFNLSNPKYASRNEHLKKDWLRFTTFTRMCLLQLVSSDRKL